MLNVPLRRADVEEVPSSEGRVSFGGCRTSGTDFRGAAAWLPLSEMVVEHNQMGAPGRIRTCDARFRKPTLYPLSYEGGAWLEPTR